MKGAAAMLSTLETALRELGVAFEREVPLASCTSFHIGGSCRFLLRPRTPEEVRDSLRAVRQSGVPFCILGNGSNVLVSDRGFDGAVVLTGGLSSLSCRENILTCGAGVPLSRLCSAALEQGLSGLEFAFGIPGSVGGAVYMNAGAYGGEMGDVLLDCTFLDETGETVTLPASELELSYRHSLFSGRRCFILEARFALRPGEQADIRGKMDEYLSRRREKQPLEFPSAGSTFKRPKNGYASALIEQCGLKGTKVGGAQVSEKHSGFLINTGGATCKDVLALIALVRRTVEEKTGCRLEREVELLGCEGEEET